ncbi:MAG: ribosome small subunit-dependent GTPase A, partial [Acidimicrobiia bacterium]
MGTATDTNLEALGWKPHWDTKLADANLDGSPARVVRHDAVKVLVTTGDSVEHVTFSRSTPLVVGDWVVVNNETVAGLLERDNELVRDTGDYGTQVIGANIDVVVVVFAADRPLKQRKVMRFVAFAGDIGATPIVIVSKTDVLDDSDAMRATLGEWLPGVDVIFTSVTQDVGISDVFDALAGRTATFIGESGVGKSSLVNALMEDEVAWIADVRETDAKGRHTTTHRELHRLPGGG